MVKYKFYLILFLITIIDQATKLFFYNKYLTILPKILYIKSFTNPGAIFGLFPNNPLILIILPLLIIILLFYGYLKNKKLWPISFIIAGLLSNIIDRIRLNHVIDFIFIPIIPKYNIALFNIADLSLIIGIILTIIFYPKS